MVIANDAIALKVNNEGL